MSNEHVIKTYKKDNLTVVWQPSLCSHSTNCWKQLLPVFNPKSRPWINLDAAENEEIKNQISKCPSGALSFIDKDETKTTPNDNIPDIEVVPGGPYIVSGEIKLKGPVASAKPKTNVIALCRCGASKNKPFCDGSHTSTTFDN